MGDNKCLSSTGSPPASLFAQYKFSQISNCEENNNKAASLVLLSLDKLTCFHFIGMSLTGKAAVFFNQIYVDVGLGKTAVLTTWLHRTGLKQIKPSYPVLSQVMPAILVLVKLGTRNQCDQDCSFCNILELNQIFAAWFTQMFPC